MFKYLALAALAFAASAEVIAYEHCDACDKERRQPKPAPEIIHPPIEIIPPMPMKPKFPPIIIEVPHGEEPIFVFEHKPDFVIDRQFPEPHDPEVPCPEPAPRVY